MTARLLAALTVLTLAAVDCNPRDARAIPATGINGGATAYAPAVRIYPPPPQPALTVEEIIRDVWPDQLEERALRIAWRESNWVPTAHNSICYGLFQIYFAVHRAWLADYGVHQPSDLYDPRTNATVAYALYEQAGWGPWKT